MEEIKHRIIVVFGSFMKAVVILESFALLVFALLFLYTLEWPVWIKVILSVMFIDSIARRIYKVANTTVKEVEDRINKQDQ